MRSLRSLIDPGGRSLVYHLDRLQHTLDAVGDRLRATVVQAVGQTVAEVTCEVLETILTERSSGHDRFPPTRPLVHRSPSLWNDPRETDPYDEAEDRSWFDDEDERSYRPHRPKVRAVGLRRLFVVSCQLAAWWLKQQASKFPLLAAVGVGLASAIVAYLTGSMALAGAGFAGSALSLLALQQVVEAVALLTRSSGS